MSIQFLSIVCKLKASVFQKIPIHFKMFIFSYFTTWLSNPKHECHRIVYGYSTDFSSLESRLQKRYDEMVLERAVVDCYYYHRYDDISRCRGITWDVKPMDNGRQLTAREAKIKQVWDFLKKDQAKRGADLP